MIKCLDHVEGIYFFLLIYTPFKEGSAAARDKLPPYPPALHILRITP